MSNILFKNAQVLDVKQQKLLAKMQVLVQDQYIVEVAQNIQCRDAQIIDVKGKVLMPGLIDAHVHVTASDIDLANDDIPASEVAIQAERFMENMLMRGFTSIRDAGGADMGLADAVKKGLLKGPRLFYCGKAISQTGGHGDFRCPNIDGNLTLCACSGSNISILADGVEEVRKAVRNELRKGATHIKIMSSGGVASPTDQITHLQYSIEEIQAFVEEAQNAGVYVMAHAYTPEAIIRCVEHGVRTIEHGNLLNEAAAEVMAKHSAYLVPTLVVYKALAALGPKLGFPHDSLLKIEKVERDGLTAIKIARQHGIKIGFGTDLLGQEGQTWQTKEFLIRAEAESPIETIRSATLINAEILQRSGLLGEISPKAFADLLVVDGNPLEDIRLLAGQGEALDLIMRDGVIYKNRLV